MIVAETVKDTQEFAEKLMDAYKKATLLNSKLDIAAISNETAALTMSKDIADDLENIIIHIMIAGLVDC